MEPTLPTPDISPNVQGPRPNNEARPATPEVPAVPGQETQPGPSPERGGELPAQGQPDPGQAQQASQDAQAQAVAAQPPQAALNDTSTPAPLVADDDDLIEKEWVAKAKQIVAQTRDDPHMQEKQVSRLQADYVKKRFGKNIKLVDM